MLKIKNSIFHLYIEKDTLQTSNFKGNNRSIFISYTFQIIMAKISLAGDFFFNDEQKIGITSYAYDYKTLSACKTKQLISTYTYIDSKNLNIYRISTFKKKS